MKRVLVLGMAAFIVVMGMQAKKADAQELRQTAYEVLMQDTDEVAGCEADGACSGGVVCTTTCECPAWYGGVDWLYWRASRSNLQFTTIGAIGDARVQQVDPEWNSGVRFTIGRKFASGWDIGFRYALYDNRTVDVAATNPAGGVATGDYTLGLDIIDIEFGHWCDVACGAAWRPFIGFRVASIDERKRQERQPIPLLPGPAIGQRMDLDAVGIIGGAEGRWDNGRRFSLFGRVAAGVLIGEYDSTMVTAVPLAPDLMLSTSGTQAIAVLDASAGASYQLIDNGSFTLDMQFGYELINFANVPDFVTVVGPTGASTASLGVDGFFLRFAGNY